MWISQQYCYFSKTKQLSTLSTAFLFVYFQIKFLNFKIKKEKAEEKA